MSGARAALPSIDAVLRRPEAGVPLERHGRQATVSALREVFDEMRARLDDQAAPDRETLAATALQRSIERLEARAEPSVRRVFNLTGTVLHTNLGRAVLAPEAVEAVRAAASEPSTVEFDLDTGKRGDREWGVEDRLCRLTGAEAATVVNNNAAAVLLVLDALAKRKEVPISRGELVEIGGAFRMPDVMARAGVRMVEVGTTNRTHLSDFEDALGPRTGLVIKVHTSNFVVQGFTASVPETSLAALCRERGVPFVVDLGSGALVDMAAWGLPAEPTPMASLADGADVVTFSGDKLLGGPQAGLIVGRADLIKKIRRNPLKRALRMDKLGLAALEATLALYEDPDRLTRRLPTLRWLTRPADDVRAMADALAPAVGNALTGTWLATSEACRSEIGSGSLPGEAIDSWGIRIQPKSGKPGKTLDRLAASFRKLPIPVIGRISDGALWLDLRCLDDVEGFRGQLGGLGGSEDT